MDKSQELVQLLEKLQYSKNVYAQAAGGMHSSAMKEELREIKESREEMIKQISRDTKSEPVKNGQPPFYQKFWVMLNDLLIQKNTPYILKTCVKADRSAIESFRKLINSRELQESTIGILRPHYEKMVDQVENFEKEIEEYPWR